ncbi:hypothetical protein Sipo8835_34525 [Streptomyces ipomoeae]|uniref:Uncharacterized protein n=1 Tax=Streptomyces ipomoeae TaxID=103232 RepID=A0AAE8VWE0_9ACTN|nr:hypothetical protein [Streptomyces ipomoeae]MDX2696360.1 hypothetical protein [Streptomyces ipomoeae]MDX2825200.1 hypothetical protein [Streptomyces ipomoeae]MDX2843525.1 hypothetical protein [Streptomyces ipomoeae]MDX2877709.1 hypothetical protein [Streptomyces ipomoeae]TQE23668.1 hypothetical protein Sipo8835_34525 [Streptomyces ipomoeae]
MPRAPLPRALSLAATLLLVTACNGNGPADSAVTLLDGQHIAVSGPTVISALPIDDEGNVDAAEARNQIPSLKSVALQYPGVRVLITDSDGHTTDSALQNFAANWAIPPALVVAADSASAGTRLSADGQLHTLLIGADEHVAADWSNHAAPTQAIVAALRKVAASPPTHSDSVVRKETP